MKLMAIIDLRGYSAAHSAMEKEGGEKNVPEYWQELVLGVKEKNYREDRARKVKRS